MRPKLFGLGLSKTGTSSLARALSYLGYRTVHNPTDHQTMLALLRGDLRCSALQENDAVCDIMFTRHFRALDRVYPESKFILTERDRARWHSSCAAHWASRRIVSTSLWNEELVDFQVYGTAIYDRSLFDDAYDSHYRAVLEYFEHQPGRLLRLNICAGDGWSPLCEYLGIPAPRIPFPHVRPAAWVRPGPIHGASSAPDHGRCTQAP
jgi:hypothetical protein